MSATANVILGLSSSIAAILAQTQHAANCKALPKAISSSKSRYRTQPFMVGGPGASKGSRRFSSSLSLKTAVTAAVNSNQPSSSDLVDQRLGNKYYFVVANAKFMLDEEEHFKELLFERLRLYGERSKQQDFWLVIEPKFLDKFPDITKRLSRPAVALVSTNGPWITFMKLRLDRVLVESYEAGSFEEALASNPTKLEFPKPEKWVAPYPKYEFGWWEPFLPPVSKEAEPKLL